MIDRFLITCEHGGNRIPSRYREFFKGHAFLLRTHRGYDPGALRMARELSSALKAPLYASTVSRLLIDLNRSITHPRVYSEATRRAPASVRQEIRQQYYDNYRDQIEHLLADWAGQGLQILHISCHSFTPELDGKRRNADVGLLYDPSRAKELVFARDWRTALKARVPELKLRMNYPYAGISDGLTTHLRRRFGAENYLGIELEIGQHIVFGDAYYWRAVRQAIIDSLSDAAASRHDLDTALPTAEILKSIPGSQV